MSKSRNNPNAADTRQPSTSGKSGGYRGKGAQSKQRRKSSNTGNAKSEFPSSRSGRTCEAAAPDGRDARMTGLNDVSWYTKNPSLSLPASRVPYPYRPGMDLPLGQNVAITDGSATTTGNVSISIPGVTAMTWVPTIGWSDSVTSPASIAAKEIYAKVRSAYSGRLYVDAPDFIPYILCLDSMFSYIGALKRIYRTLDAYYPDNFSVPNQLLQAMGISPTEATNLRTNRADFLLAINELVAATRKFAMPNVMDIFNRHYWLNDNVYSDAESMNSQMYVFRQDAFFFFSLLDTTGAEIGLDGVGASGARLNAAPWTPGAQTITVASLYNFGMDMINVLANSEDAYTISGYLMRAYEGAAQFVVAPITEQDRLSIVYVPEVLMQIENAEPLFADSYTVAAQMMGTSWNVWQDPATNALYCKPSVNLSSTNVTQYAEWQWKAGLNHIINMHVDDPTAGDTIVATRLKSRLKIERGASNSYYVRVSPASEILLSCEVYDRSSNPWYLPATSVVYMPASGVVAATQNTARSTLSNLLRMSQYAHHPITLVTVCASSGYAAALTGDTIIVGDVQNVTIMHDDELANLNRVCLYSEFNAFGEA